MKQKDKEPIDKKTNIKYANDRIYKVIVKKFVAAGLSIPCPHCMIKHHKFIQEGQVMFLDKNNALNSVSRRNGEHICRMCGKIEMLADYTGLSDEDHAWAAVYQDWQEAIRLPPGIFWGATNWPTGGMQDWFDELNAHIAVLEGNF